MNHIRKLKKDPIFVTPQNIPSRTKYVFIGKRKAVSINPNNPKLKNTDYHSEGFEGLCDSANCKEKFCGTQVCGKTINIWSRFHTTTNKNLKFTPEEIGHKKLMNLGKPTFSDNEKYKDKEQSIVWYNKPILTNNDEINIDTEATAKIKEKKIDIKIYEISIAQDNIKESGSNSNRNKDEEIW
jgi:hypothetical protein